MVLGLHIVPSPSLGQVCPPVIGWRARFLHAIRPSAVACTGARELPIYADPDRVPLLAGAVLSFEDYGWPYSEAVLAEDLAPSDTVAMVEPLPTRLYPTARAAAGAYSLVGATITGTVTDGRDGGEIASFSPRFVAPLESGLIDAEVSLGDLPNFVERCDDPPYWLKVLVEQDGVTTTLFLGQTKNDVLLPSDSNLLVRFELLPSQDPTQVAGVGVASLAQLVLNGTAVLGLFAEINGSQTLGQLLAAGAGGVEVGGDGAQTFGAIATTGDAVVQIVANGAQALGAITTAGGSVASVVATGAQTLGAVTTVGAGGVETIGDGAQALGAVDTAGAGNLQTDGDGAQVLGSISTEGAADLSGIIPTLLIPSAF